MEHGQHFRLAWRLSLILRLTYLLTGVSKVNGYWYQLETTYSHVLRVRRDDLEGHPQTIAALDPTSSNDFGRRVLRLTKQSPSSRRLVVRPWVELSTCCSGWYQESLGMGRVDHAT